MTATALAWVERSASVVSGQLAQWVATAARPLDRPMRSAGPGAAVVAALVAVAVAGGLSFVVTKDGVAIRPGPWSVGGSASPPPGWRCSGRERS